MIAQVIYQDIGGRYKNAEVLKVVEFNGDPISEKFSADQVKSIVAGRTSASRQVQDALFIEQED